MKLPSKTIPYKKSVMELFPAILSLLIKKDMYAGDLRMALAEVPLGDLISALDCLYALRLIELDVEKGLISYAGTNSM